jgi:hypothetical protein
MEKNYLRFLYIRYVDEFLITIIATKTEALAIKHKRTAYLNQLNMNLSDDKTLITKPKDIPLSFLGSVIQNALFIGIYYATPLLPICSGSYEIVSGGVHQFYRYSAVPMATFAFGFGFDSTVAFSSRVLLLQSLRNLPRVANPLVLVDLHSNNRFFIC